MGRLTAAVLATLAVIAGCAALHPERQAPSTFARPWTPPAAARELFPAPAPGAASFLARGCADLETTAAHSLASLSDVALLHNPSTRTAWANAKTAAADYGVALGPYYPTVEVTANAGYQRLVFQALPSAWAVGQLQFEPLAALSYTLLDFGQRAGTSGEAYQQVLAANFTFNRQIQSVVFGVQQAYFALDAAQAMVRAAEHSVEQAEVVLQTATRKLDVGLGTLPEVLLARRTKAKSLYDLESARVLVSDGRAALALALGLPATCAVEILSLGDADLPARLDASVESLMDASLAERPDLAAALAAVRASEKSLEAARGQLLPVIGLNANVGGDLWRYSINGERTIGTLEPTYAALVTVTWPAFEGFALENGVRSAAAAREAAESQLTSALQEATTEVWRAYQRVAVSRRRYEFAVALLASADEAFAATLSGFKTGLATAEELFDADRAAANGRYAVVQSRAELLTAAAALAYAAGTTAAKPVSPATPSGAEGATPKDSTVPAPSAPEPTEAPQPRGL